MEGKNTMGCTINGEIFTVSSKAIRDSWNHYGTYASYSLSNTSFLLLAKRNKPDRVQVIIKLRFNEGQTIYEINNKELSVGIVYMPVDNYVLAESRFSTNNEHKGLVEVLKLEFNDETGEGFVAGLFEFDAIDSRGEVIQVREGRFDMSFGW
jgi:hypothetical protein